MDIATLGIQIDSTGAAKAVTDLDKLTGAAGKAELATGRVGSASVVASTGMAKGAHQSRMMAMQLSQVAQQASATGNWVQALAIQLPDMALGLGTVGIAAGVLAGVALPLLAQWLGSTATKAVELKDALGRLSEIQAGLEASQDIMQMNLVELYNQYGLNALAVRQYAAAIADLEVAKTKTALAQTVLKSAEALDRYTTSANTAFSSGQMLSTVFYNLKTDLGVTGRSATELQGAFQQLKEAMSFEDRAAALMRIYAAMKSAGVAAEKLPDELQKAVLEAYQAQTKMADLAKAAADAAAAASRIAGNIPKSSWLDGPISAASRLAATLWDAAAAKAAALGGGGPRDDMSYGNSNWSKNSLGFTKPGSELVYTPPKGAKGGGGGGATDDFAQRLKALQDEFATKKQIEDQWYLDAQKTLADRRAVEILGETEHKAALEALEQQHQAKLLEIANAGREMERSSRNAAYSEAEGLLNMFAGKSKAAAIAAIAINKGLRIAEIVQNTAAAQMRAYAELGPIAGAVAAAKIGLYGKIQAGIVAASGLAQAAGRLGGGGGGSTAAQGAAAAPQMAQATLTVKGISKDTLLTGGMMQDIFEGVMSVAKDRNLQIVYV